MNVRFEPADGLRGDITAPPDKSISHRAALLGAMTDEPVRIHNYLHAEDTHSTLNALRSLGALVEERDDAGREDRRRRGDRGERDERDQREAALEAEQADEHPRGHDRHQQPRDHGPHPHRVASRR